MPFGREVEVPDVSYTRSGDVSIAYQVVGDGPTDLVVLPFLSNLYTLWQAPKFAEFGYRLAEGRRLIMVNARGVGLSDRPRGFTIESRMDDLRAVMDAVGSERPALLGIAEAAATCAVFAASNPDRVEQLILYDPWSQSMLNDREREEALAGVPAQRDRWGRRDGLEQFAVELNPQWADDPGVKSYFAFMKQYMPTADLSNSNYAAGYHYATLLMTVLNACKDDVSRDNILKQAASLKEVKLPLLLPGMSVSTGPDDYLPFQQLQLRRFNGKSWVPFGGILDDR